MENVLMKTRIAMMWIFMIFVGMTRSSAMEYEQLAAGELPPQLAPGYLLWGAAASLALFVIPFLCLTLKDSSNRKVNVILGIAFTAVGIAGTSADLPGLTASNAHLTIMDAAATVAPALITYYAYRWPKE